MLAAAFYRSSQHPPWILRLLRMTQLRDISMAQGANTSRPVEILLVEDNPGDVRLAMEALREGKVSSNLSIVRDGVEAMAFLRRQGKYARARRPDIILLDWNLPRKSGREALKEIKSDPILRRIPVVVLTTSSAEQDIAGAYELHANCYIAKPVDFEQFINVVRSIQQFWLTIVELPNGESSK
jgi:CheY-like chemotaxis protein